ncbi:MarR family winged helix-turn-helix transcriptional regulator [Methanoregula sp.]|uniref:MarR family winged helix-turn-helix transcriptional regulator n=1 Tax=Methanoregula sp. TaxID=2052170 RepID=UPI00356A15F7
MTEQEEHLFEVLDHLLRIRNECSCSIFSECGLSDMTVKQIAYLRLINDEGDITFSRLAEITKNSKPTITEMINKCVRMECAYREQCPDDGRILYIRLTEKGRSIAQAEQASLRRMIERLMDSLDEHEQELLVEILKKVR